MCISKLHPILNWLFCWHWHDSCVVFDSFGREATTNMTTKCFHGLQSMFSVHSVLQLQSKAMVNLLSSEESTVKFVDDLKLSLCTYIGDWYEFVLSQPHTWDKHGWTESASTKWYKIINELAITIVLIYSISKIKIVKTTRNHQDFAVNVGRWMFIFSATGSVERLIGKLLVFWRSIVVLRCGVFVDLYLGRGCWFFQGWEGLYSQNANFKNIVKYIYIYNYIHYTYLFDCMKLYVNKCCVLWSESWWIYQKKIHWELLPQSELRIACIRSWQRLVDEFGARFFGIQDHSGKNWPTRDKEGDNLSFVLRFTGMLAFAPMPCVPASLHDMAKMRVGTGQLGAQETKTRS